jgi:hypothetical protein
MILSIITNSSLFLGNLVFLDLHIKVEIQSDLEPNPASLSAGDKEVV